MAAPWSRHPGRIGRRRGLLSGGAVSFGALGCVCVGCCVGCCCATGRFGGGRFGAAGRVRIHTVRLLPWFRMVRIHMVRPQPARRWAASSASLRCGGLGGRRSGRGLLGGRRLRPGTALPQPPRPAPGPRRLLRLRRRGHVRDHRGRCFGRCLSDGDGRLERRLDDRVLLRRRRRDHRRGPGAASRRPPPARPERSGPRAPSRRHRARAAPRSG